MKYIGTFNNSTSYPTGTIYKGYTYLLQNNSTIGSKTVTANSYLVALVDNPGSNDLNWINIKDTYIAEDITNRNQPNGYAALDGLGKISNSNLPTYNLDSLTDVIVNNPTTNQILKFDGSNWTNTNNVAVTNLDSLTDVAISNPTTNQILKFDGSNWTNGDPPQSSIPSLYGYNEYIWGRFVNIFSKDLKDANDCVTKFGNVSTIGWMNQTYNLRDMIVSNYNNNSTFGIKVRCGAVRVVLSVTTDITVGATAQTNRLQLLVDGILVSEASGVNSIYGSSGDSLLLLVQFDLSLTPNTPEKSPYKEVSEKIWAVQLKAYVPEPTCSLFALKLTMKIYY